MKKWVSVLIIVLLSAGAVFGAPTNDGLYAQLQTTMGSVCFELHYTNVPQTVANFVSLAEGSRSWIDPRNNLISKDPFYNGIIFHRVISNFMIQAGSPQGTGSDGPGYSFEDEFDAALRHNKPGTVSMANSGFDSNGSQFFITVAATPWLDGEHSVFGKVVEGMDVVSNIAGVVTDDSDKPLIAITITNVSIIRNGIHAQHFSETNQSLPTAEHLPLQLGVQTGVTVWAATKANAQHYVYASSNLTDWISVYSAYSEDAAFSNTLLTGEGAGRRYYHATGVTYIPDPHRTVTPADHELTITIDANTFFTAPVETNAGTIQVNTGPITNITAWSWVKQYPHKARYTVYSSYYFPFLFDLHYTTPTNGRCVGYYFNLWWRQIGEGTFTDRHP